MLRTEDGATLTAAEARERVAARQAQERILAFRFDAAPSLGPSQLRPGEIFGPNFYAHRTPLLRQTLEEASYHQQVERQQARHGGGGPPPVTIRAREARGKSFGGGAYQAEMLKHQHDGVYLQSEPPCSRADAYKKSSNPSTGQCRVEPQAAQ